MAKCIMSSLKLMVQPTPMAAPQNVAAFASGISSFGADQLKIADCLSFLSAHAKAIIFIFPPRFATCRKLYRLRKN